MNLAPQKGAITTRKVFVAIGRRGEGYLSRVMHGKLYWTPSLDQAMRFADAKMIAVALQPAPADAPLMVQVLRLEESLKVMSGPVKLPAPKAEPAPAKPKAEPTKVAAQ